MPPADSEIGIPQVAYRQIGTVFLSAGGSADTQTPTAPRTQAITVAAIWITPGFWPNPAAAAKTAYAAA
jgi:hypothetical protein